MSPETEIFLIPAPDEPLITPTGQRFMQIQAIPVEMKQVTFPAHIVYAHFSAPPVSLRAGGFDINETNQRIRWQMVYHLQIYSEALKKPDPPLNAPGAIEVIQQYIRILETP